MGGSSSKHRSTAMNPYTGRNTVLEKQGHLQRSDEGLMTPPSPTATRSSKEKQTATKELRTSFGDDNDEFYDGIPQYQRSLYRKSRSLRATKVSEVSSRLSRVGSAGLGKAAEVLDTLGISGSGFVSGPTTKSNELSILAFEVANTLVKGSSLMESLSKRSLRHLKEVVLPEEGVQRLISNDMDELLRIVASDKREELKVFLGEVVRFGNRCKDPQWHDLDRFFEKRSRDRTSQKQLRATAESFMLQLMASVLLTAELYKELHRLDTFEQDYQLKRVDIKYNATQRGDRDNSLSTLTAELKNQRKLVKTLKKKSLWSRSMEEVMEKLVDIVLFLNQEINYTFGNPESVTLAEGVSSNHRRLGPAGLALHYANIILQIDSVVARSGSILPMSRRTLYMSLPPNILDSLRTKLRSFHVDKELNVIEIQDEMEKTLHWLVPVATNTAKAHHGFGWVGEWASTGSEPSRASTMGLINTMKIETLHHADKNKTEDYILHLLLWLNYLVNRFSKAFANRGRAATNKEPDLQLKD